MECAGAQSDSATARSDTPSGGQYPTSSWKLATIPLVPQMDE